jgi:hypothetical protein
MFAGHHALPAAPHRERPRSPSAASEARAGHPAAARCCRATHTEMGFPVDIPRGTCHGCCCARWRQCGASSPRTHHRRSVIGRLDRLGVAACRVRAQVDVARGVPRRRTVTSLRSTRISRSLAASDRAALRTQVVAPFGIGGPGLEGTEQTPGDETIAAVTTALDPELAGVLVEGVNFGREIPGLPRSSRV